MMIKADSKRIDTQRRIEPFDTIPELHFLGTGSAFAVDQAHSSAIGFDPDDDHTILMFDCGSGIFTRLLALYPYILQKGYTLNVFVTHRHADHIGDLPVLLQYHKYENPDFNLNVFAGSYDIPQLYQFLSACDVERDDIDPIIAIDDEGHVFRHHEPVAFKRNTAFAKANPKTRLAVFGRRIMHSIPDTEYIVAYRAADKCSHVMVYSGDTCDKDDLKHVMSHTIEEPRRDSILPILDRLYIDCTYPATDDEMQALIDDSIDFRRVNTDRRIHMSIPVLCKYIPKTRRERVSLMHAESRRVFDQGYELGFTPTFLASRVPDKSVNARIKA